MNSTSHATPAVCHYGILPGVEGATLRVENRNHLDVKVAISETGVFRAILGNGTKSC